MKIVIIGGAGYIGCHVVRAAQAAGHNVIVYDNLTHGCRENLPDNTRFIQGDIFDIKLVDILSDAVDAVIHLAASKSVGESMEHPHDYARNNIAGTIQVLDAMRCCDIKHFVFSSTAAVYGTPQFLPLNEDHPTEPDSFYGFTKLQIEKILEWYNRLGVLRSAVLRYFNVIGYAVNSGIVRPESETTNLLPIILEVACGRRKECNIFGNDYDTDDGTGVRDYIHVSDIARAHMCALDYILTADTCLTANLGIGKGYSVLEMLRAAERCVGKRIPARVVDRRPGDPATIFATADRALKLLGWKPEYTELEDMVGTAWEIYRQYYSGALV